MYKFEYKFHMKFVRCMQLTKTFCFQPKSNLAPGFAPHKSHFTNCQAPPLRVRMNGRASLRDSDLKVWTGQDWRKTRGPSYCGGGWGTRRPTSGQRETLMKNFRNNIKMSCRSAYELEI